MSYETPGTSAHRASARARRSWRRLPALVALATTAIASPAAATLLLTGRFIQLPIDDTGQRGRFMGTADSQGAKYNRLGTGGASGQDFWVFGTPVYNYTIAVGGQFRTNGAGWASGPTVTDTSSGLRRSARIDGSPFATLSFSRSVSFDDADQVVVIRDTLRNTGASTLTQVATLDNTDPDQDVSSTFATLNDVVSAAAPNDLVLATGPADGLTVGMGSESPLRVVDASGFSNTNPYSIIAAPQDPNGAAGDIGIDLAINYGSLPSGASVSVTWILAFGASKSAATANYLAALAVCGNGIVEPGEACDEGPGNGTSHSCCTTGCTPVCDDGNPCTDDLCDSTGGAFVCSHANNTAPCTSGSACVVGATCSGGICGGGTPRVCDDHNPCTDDACDSATGCFTTFNSAPCDDHNACTDNDHCSVGTCQGGGFNANPCDDGNPCTVNDHCSFGFCQSGGPRNCDDHNPCTTEFCQPFFGCVFTNLDGIKCDDLNPCTTDDFCHVGHCTGDARNCFDDDPCTVDTCNSAGGAFLCLHESCTSFPGGGCPAACLPAGCGNGRIDPGETCDPPDPTPMPGRPGDVKCRPDCTFCGDGVVQAGHAETCDDGNELTGCTPGRPNVPIDACQNGCTAPICNSPSRIRLATGPSAFTMHGWITPVPPADTVDPHADGFTVELTDTGGVVIFRSSLDRGLVLPRGSGFRYTDAAARKSGGIGKLRILQHGDEFVVALKAYGDTSTAADHMTLHVFVGSQEWTLSGRWVQSSRGWTLDLPSTFAGS